jgi:hypothetical protein
MYDLNSNRVKRKGGWLVHLDRSLEATAMRERDGGGRDGEGEEDQPGVDQLGVSKKILILLLVYNR